MAIGVTPALEDLGLGLGGEAEADDGLRVVQGLSEYIEWSEVHDSSRREVGGWRGFIQAFILRLWSPPFSLWPPFKLCRALETGIQPIMYTNISGESCQYKSYTYLFPV